MNRIITIVGGTGFLGRYVVKLLAAQGYQIRVLAREVESALPLKTAGDPGQIALISADITRPESLEGKLDNSYAVINLVGILFERGRQTFSGVHEKGPAKLAELAAKAGAERFVHVSSLGADIASKAKYARTKAAGETAVQSTFPQATILRPSILFGPEDNFFNQFACMASLSPVLPLFGGGKNKFQPIYVMDVAQAIVACLEREDVQGKIYELGGPDIFTFRQILEFICQTIGKKRLFISIPYFAATIGSFFAQFLPTPPLTPDQVKLLQSDNVVSHTSNTLEKLNIRPQAVKNIVPMYLSRFKATLA
jgi:NADH dehydrogenase